MRCMRCIFALFVFALTAGAADHHVLSFYYGWYGNPETSGRWVHWKSVDPAAKKIGGSTNYPLLGAYDTHDPATVARHCRDARAAGITGFIATWWGRGEFSDKGMKLLLDSAQKEGLKVTIYYETAPPKGSPSVEGAVADFEYLIAEYALHPAWLRVAGKPAFFVYSRAVTELKLDGWQQVIAEVNRRRGGTVFIGDRLSAEAARVFDGIHTYNITGRTRDRSVTEIVDWARKAFPEWVALAGGKISCVTIIPGYDDSTQGRAEPRPITHRHDGETYRALWQQAIAANPDWILITSFNEWHEGSEIEPSVENGDREMKTTAEFAPKFTRSGTGAVRR